MSRFTEQEVLDWAMRHDLTGCITDLRCALEDAASLRPQPLPQQHRAMLAKTEAGIVRAMSDEQIFSIVQELYGLRKAARKERRT